MRALLLRDDPDSRAQIADVSEADLPAGDVLIDVAYSSLNYKDGLAVTGKGKIVRGRYPFVPGIDLVGTVAGSDAEAWGVGDRVILTGWGTGEDRWGGYAERARAKAEHLVRLPDGLSMRQAMAFGTAGFTAMLSVMALEAASVRPGEGPVAVTGASGGVGSLAVSILAALDYEVAAVTGTERAHGYLKTLGARTILPRTDLSEPGPPLGKGRWAGAVDSVGSATLANLLATTKRHGAVAACGLAGGAELNATVYPFILRGVSLLGIDSNTCPPARRARAWERLASTVDAETLDSLTTTIALDDVPKWAEKIVRGDTQGRVVVEVGGRQGE